MAYTWDAFPQTGILNFESIARSTLETWRTNSEAMEFRLDGFDDGTGYTSNTIPGTAIANDTISYQQIDTNGTSPSALDVLRWTGNEFEFVPAAPDNSISADQIDTTSAPDASDLLRWNGTNFDWVPAEASGDTYQVKDAVGDGSPDFLAVKVAKYMSSSNLLINPNFIVNQEEFAGTPSTDDPYIMFDMWKTSAVGTGPSLSVAGDDITIVNTVLTQVNDDLISDSANSDITITISVATGSVFVDNEAGDGLVVTPSLPLTLTYNSTANAPLYIGTTANTYVFSGLKVSLGSEATLYERPRVTTEELKCYRYYYRLQVESNDIMLIGSGYAAVVNLGRFGLPLPVPMRAAPAIGSDNITSLRLTAGGTSADAASINQSNVSLQGCTCCFEISTTTSDLTALHACVIRPIDSASHYLDFDARY